MGDLLRPPLEAEEERSRPARAGDHAGHFGQRSVASAAVDDAVVEHRDPVTDAAPLADQHGARRNTLIWHTLSAHSSAPLTHPVEEPLRRWLEPTEPSLLQPVSDRPDHEDACEERGRVSAE